MPRVTRRIIAQTLQTHIDRLDVTRIVLEAFKGHVQQEMRHKESLQLTFDVLDRLRKGARGLQSLVESREFGRHGFHQTQVLTADERQTRACLVLFLLKLQLIDRPVALHRSGLDGCGRQVRTQFFKALKTLGDRRNDGTLHLHALQSVQIALQITHLFTKLQLKKPPQTGAMRLSSILQIVKHVQSTRISLVHQSRMSYQREPPAANFHEFRQFPKRPIGNVVCQVRRNGSVGLSHIAESLLRLGTELGTKLGQISAHSDLPPVFVKHLEVHKQVRLQHFKLKVGALASRPGLFSNVGNQRVH